MVPARLLRVDAQLLHQRLAGGVVGRVGHPGAARSAAGSGPRRRPGAAARIAARLTSRGPMPYPSGHVRGISSPVSGVEADAVGDARAGRRPDGQPDGLAVGVVLDPARVSLSKRSHSPSWTSTTSPSTIDLLGAAGDELVDLLLVAVAVVGHLVPRLVAPHAHRQALRPRAPPRDRGRPRRRRAARAARRRPRRSCSSASLIGSPRDGIAAAILGQRGGGLSPRRTGSARARGSGPAARPPRAPPARRPA